MESYPFTTKRISLGHFDADHMRYQVIDTPGLLDREMSRRNEIEKQAVAALRFLAHVIIFVLDLTEMCGYEVSKQESLLRTVSGQFPNIPMVIVENKSDLFDEKSTRIRISALTGDGVDELKEIAAEAARNRALEVARSQVSH